MTTRTLIHLSDLHIGRRKKEDRRVKRTFLQIAQSYPKARVLITGDVTDSATTNQFRKARKMLDGLAETNPVLVVPGNHDYAWKGIAWLEPRWQEWNKYLGSPLGWEEPPTPWMQSSHEPIGFDGVGVWKDGPFVYFGVDSGDPENVVRTARGWISRELVENLTAALKKYEGKTRVVFVHHHPFMHKQEMKMVGAQRFLQAVKNNCELLLFGHKHHYGLWKNRDGVPLTIASHRTTNRLIDRKFLAITVIELQNAGQSKMSFDHRLDLVA